MRVWAARYTGEAGQLNSSALTRLQTLAADAEPRVRAAAATALRQFTAGALTINRTPVLAGPEVNLTAHFQALLSRPSVDGDFYYPHIVWMAIEPRIAADPKPFLPLLTANPNAVSAYCAHRLMRRISDLTDAAARTESLNAAFRWLGDIASQSQLAEAALDGLIEAQKSKGAPPTVDVEPIFARLTANPAVANKAQRLAAALGDQSAARLLIARINDPQASPADRLRGIAAAREAKTDSARDALLKLIREPLKEPSPTATRLKSEAVQALAATGGYDAAYQIVDHWKHLPLPSRIVAAESLVRGPSQAGLSSLALRKGSLLQARSPRPRAGPWRKVKMRPSRTIRCGCSAVIARPAPRNSN